MAENQGSHKILVTGGAGFIGSHVAQKFLDAGHEVIIIDNLSNGSQENIPPGAIFYPVDICNRKELEKICKKEKPSIINHHAAQIDIRISLQAPEEDANTNVVGMIHLLECAKTYHTLKFIFASSGGAMYGECEKTNPDEKMPPAPMSHYGISKWCGEHYLHLYSHLYGLDFTILRYGNVYGPRQSPTGEGGVIALFIHAMLNQKPPMIFGDGHQTRDFVFVEDVANANFLALEKGGGQIINIGSGQNTSVNELYALLKEALGFQKDPLFKPKREGELFSSRLKIDFAKKSLGWSPQVFMEEGLKKTIAWQKTKGIDKP